MAKIGTWWIMPAAAVGMSLYAKWKMSRHVRWFMGTEEDAKRTPVALLIYKIETGLELPQPPEGFHWKEIVLLMATTPVAAPEEVHVNVLERWLADAVKPGSAPAAPPGAPPYVGGLGSSYITVEDLAVSPRASGMGADDAEGAAALRRAITESGPLLRANGMAMVRLDPREVRAGDFVVDRACRLAYVTASAVGPAGARFEAEEMHPERGARRAVGAGDVLCAFGPRRA